VAALEVQRAPHAPLRAADAIAAAMAARPLPRVPRGAERVLHHDPSTAASAAAAAAVVAVAQLQARDERRDERRDEGRDEGRDGRGEIVLVGGGE